MSSAYTDGCGNGTFAYKAQGSGGQHSVTKSLQLKLDNAFRQHQQRFTYPEGDPLSDNTVWRGR